MNTILKTLLIIACVISAIIALSMTVIFIIPVTSHNCLMSQANDYCANLGYTHHSHTTENNWFKCYKNYNPRTKTYTSEKFYFLKKELSECITKDSFTFKKKIDRFVGVDE